MNKLSLEASALSDFLFYTLDRANLLRLPVESVVDVRDVPKLSSMRCTLPALAACCGLSEFEQVWSLAHEYRQPARSALFLSHKSDPVAYDELVAVLRAVEPQWRRFREFWQTTVAPVAQRFHAAWRAEDEKHAVLHALEQAVRLPWPTERCRVFVSVFHPAASAPRRTGCIFGAAGGFDFQRRNTLARLLGHEGLHAMTEERYHDHPALLRAVAAARQRQFDPNIIRGSTEEMLAVAMQHRLLVECGLCDETVLRRGEIDSQLAGEISYARRRSDREAAFVERYYWKLQDNWPAYRTSNNYATIVDFACECAERVVRELC